MLVFLISIAVAALLLTNLYSFLFESPLSIQELEQIRQAADERTRLIGTEASNRQGQSSER